MGGVADKGCLGHLELFASRRFRVGRGLFWGSRLVWGLFCQGLVCFVRCGVFYELLAGYGIEGFCKRVGTFVVASLRCGGRIGGNRRSEVVAQLLFPGKKVSRYLSFVIADR